MHMTRAQLPASLRAVDAVAADVFHESARRVGILVYGHPGGLTVKERYKLVEKREVLLRSTRKLCEEEHTTTAAVHRTVPMLLYRTLPYPTYQSVRSVCAVRCCCAYYCCACVRALHYLHSNEVDLYPGNYAANRYEYCTRSREDYRYTERKSSASRSTEKYINGVSSRIFQGLRCSLLRARKHFLVASRYGCRPNPTPNPRPEMPLRRL